MGESKKTRFPSHLPQISSLQTNILEEYRDTQRPRAREVSIIDNPLDLFELTEDEQKIAIEQLEVSSSSSKSNLTFLKMIHYLNSPISETETARVKEKLENIMLDYSFRSKLKEQFEKIKSEKKKKDQTQ